MLASLVKNDFEWFMLYIFTIEAKQQTSPSKSSSYQRRRSVFRIGGEGWAKSDHGAKTLYVYLLTSSILCKNTAYLGWRRGVK